jgi:hypothetical protein
MTKMALNSHGLRTFCKKINTNRKLTSKLFWVPSVVMSVSGASGVVVFTVSVGEESL